MVSISGSSTVILQNSDFLPSLVLVEITVSPMPFDVNKPLLLTAATLLFSDAQETFLRIIRTRRKSNFVVFL